MAEKVANADTQVARIAARQHGVVSIRQLRASGLSDDAVLGRVRAGRLYRIHRGVYAVGHPGMSHERLAMAAALACGPTAAVSHRNAAALWGLLSAPDGVVDVSVPGTGGRARRRGIRIHRRKSLGPVSITIHRGIPLTTPARTIADLRGVVSEKDRRRAIRQADVRGLPHGGDVRRDRTRSDLERDFLQICRRHRLPKPQVNVRVGPYLVDFLWPDRGLVVETDGYRYHRGRQAHRDDRRRDLELRARGFEVLRLSEEQIDDEPERVARILAEVLASGRHRVGRDGGGQG